MRALAAAAGHPERAHPCVLVAGTNGKGSTSAVLASILRRAGHVTGLFTSPHLVDFRERIRVDGRAVSVEEAARLVRDLRPHVEAQKATFFEATTAMALRHFADRGVDFAVLEVGLGGRLDATNVADPAVSVITGIAMDHAHILGRSLALIAREKCGIIREGGHVVTGAAGPGLRVIEEICRERRARLWRVGKDLRVRVARVDASGTEFDLEPAAGGSGLRAALAGRWRARLCGAHQARNAACALLAAAALAERGIAIDVDAARDGLAAARWPARFEVFPGRPTIVLDAAHNLEGARALRATLDAVFPGRDMVLVAGMLADKDHAGFCRHVVPRARHVVATQPSEERALAAADLAKDVARMARPCEIVPSVARAAALGRGRAGPGGVLLVAGSLFTVGEAMSALGLGDLEEI
jgi:dihydrofolate synthase/folylpolyglutamate synthase